MDEGRLAEAQQPDILFQKARWLLNECTDWELGMAKVFCFFLNNS